MHGILQCPKAADKHRTPNKAPQDACRESGRSRLWDHALSLFYQPDCACAESRGRNHATTTASHILGTRSENIAAVFHTLRNRRERIEDCKAKNQDRTKDCVPKVRRLEERGEAAKTRHARGGSIRLALGAAAQRCPNTIGSTSGWTEMKTRALGYARWKNAVQSLRITA